MLKFFRKIREKLFVEGNLKKYLFYAFGEILLLVLGILIALQINNWNEWRKERIEEQDLLESILDEFQFNEKETKRSIGVAQMIQSKCRLLIQNTGSKGVKISKRESDSLIYGGLTRIISLDVSEGIISTLLNTGKIQIIRNDSLRNLLSNWPSKIEDVKEDEVWAIDRRNNFIIPYLNKHYSSISEYSDLSSGFAISYKDIYQKIEFENIIDSHRSFNRNNERNYTILLSSLNHVIDLCQQEISKS